MMLVAFTTLYSALSYVPGSLIMKMSAFFPYKAAGPMIGELPKTRA